MERGERSKQRQGQLGPFGNKVAGGVLFAPLALLSRKGYDT